MIEYLIIAVAIGVGLFVGRALAKARSARVLAEAGGKAQGVTAEAQKRAAEVQKQGEAEAEEEARKVRRDAEELLAQSDEQKTLLEERISRLEGKNEQRQERLAEKQLALDARKKELDDQRRQARDAKGQTKQCQKDYWKAIEARCEESAEQVSRRISDVLVEETRALCADRLRNLETAETEDLVRQAKRIMGIALGRFRRESNSSRLPAVLPLDGEGVKRLKPHLELIQEQTGVKLLLADNEESIRLEGGDGTSRELARRAITRFASKGQVVRDGEKLFRSIAADLERELMDSGRKAFSLLKLKPADPEIQRLIGRLNYRSSYTQNQWVHSIEAAFLAGLMAAEMQLDVTVARRATLLHDMGKALTHEVEGSHAVLGAEIARRCGEDEVVCNAVGSHHGDEPAKSPYAHLVAAADAISGARPGARREMMETYVERLADLERIATDFPGVNTVHAVQAGRELRVHVDEHRVDDSRAETLSSEIADRISDELIFPGQIRVTVIREFKAVETAS